METKFNMRTKLKLLDVLIEEHALEVAGTRPCPFDVRKRNFFDLLWNTRKPKSIPKSVCGCLLATLSDFTKDDFITFLEASGHYPTWGMKYTDSGMCGDKGYNYQASFRFVLEDGDSVEFNLYDRYGGWRVGGNDERIIGILQELGFSIYGIDSSNALQNQLMIQQVAIACEG
jgi:hypothetical protein